MAPLNFFGAYHQRGRTGANRLPSTVAAPVGKRSPMSTLVFAVTQCPAAATCETGCLAQAECRRRPSLRCRAKTQSVGP